MGNFLEIIEWFDDTGKEIAHRIPEEGSGDIKYGAQLTVRESQAAIFFYEGKAYDAVGAGRYTLTTLNIPIITKLAEPSLGIYESAAGRSIFYQYEDLYEPCMGNERPRRVQGFDTRAYQASGLRDVQYQGHPAIALYQYPRGDKSVLYGRRY